MGEGLWGIPHHTQRARRCLASFLPNRSVEDIGGPGRTPTPQASRTQWEQPLRACRAQSGTAAPCSVQIRIWATNSSWLKAAWHAPHRDSNPSARADGLTFQVHGAGTALRHTEPNWVPVRPSCSRSTHSKGVSGPIGTGCWHYYEIVQTEQPNSLGAPLRSAAELHASSGGWRPQDSFDGIVWLARRTRRSLGNAGYDSSHIPVHAAMRRADETQAERDKPRYHAVRRLSYVLVRNLIQFPLPNIRLIRRPHIIEVYNL